VYAESKDKSETDVIKGGAKLKTRDIKVRLSTKARYSLSNGIRIFIIYTSKIL
jgi:hypothetical protein